MTCKKFYAKKDINGFPVPGTMMGYDKYQDCLCSLLEIPEETPSVLPGQTQSFHPGKVRFFIGLDCDGKIIPNSLISSKKHPGGNVIEFKKVTGTPFTTTTTTIAPTTTTTTAAPTTTTSTTTIAPALILTFTSEFPVVDANDVSLWNTKLGSTFTAVSISGFEARLTGGSPFNMLQSALVGSGLLSIDDQINSVQQLSTYSLAANSGLNTIKLPGLTSIINNYNFMGSSTDPGDVIIYIPLCESIGATVGDNSVFSSAFGGKNITLTVPVSRITCNAGNPDGDIQYLQSGNTVTIVTV